MPLQSEQTRREPTTENGSFTWQNESERVVWGESATQDEVATLPAAASVTRRDEIMITNVSSTHSITVSPTGADTVAGASSLQIEPNGSATLLSNAVDGFIVVALVGSTTAAIVTPPPAELALFVQGAEYQGRLLLESTVNVQNDAFDPLYEGRYHMDVAVNAWLASGDPVYIDQAMTYIDQIFASSNMTIPRDATAAQVLPEWEGARPTTARGATQASYLHWDNRAFWLIHVQFAVGVFKMIFEVMNSPIHNATPSQMAWINANIELVYQTLVEKFLTSFGRSFNDQNLGIEAAVTMTPTAVAAANRTRWSDTYIMSITALAYLDRILEDLGMAKPTWLVSQGGSRPNQDWRSWARDLYVVDPTAVGETNGAPKTNGFIYDWDGDIGLNPADIIFLDVNNPALSEPHQETWDAGHSDRWMECSFALKRLNVLSFDPALSAKVEQSIAQFESNMSYIVTAPGACTSINHFVNGSDDSAIASNDHSGFIFPARLLYGVGNSVLSPQLDQLKDNAIAHNSGATAACPHFSVARHATAVARGTLIAASALFATRTRSEVFDAI